VGTGGSNSKKAKTGWFNLLRKVRAEKGLFCQWWWWWWRWWWWWWWWEIFCKHT
jgi:hypothetical protein